MITYDINLKSTVSLKRTDGFRSLIVPSHEKIILEIDMNYNLCVLNDYLSLVI